MKNLKIIIFIVIASLLTGCIGAMVAGAAGSVVVYDRRSISMIEKDARIFYVINRTIANDRNFYNSHVNITSYNQVLLLSGQVTSEELKNTALKIAQDTPNVKRVYNELTVEEPTTMAIRSKDALITSQIRTKMLAKKGLTSGSIRVITENGNVYLMGIVNREQAELAVNIARETSGVNKVIKIFQYVL